MKSIHILADEKQAQRLVEELELAGQCCTVGTDIPPGAEFVLTGTGRTGQRAPRELAKAVLGELKYVRARKLRAHTARDFIFADFWGDVPEDVRLARKTAREQEQHVPDYAKRGTQNLHRQGASPLPQEPRVAVAVTCHGAYLSRLAACLHAVESQTARPAQRFLALDGCDLPEHLATYVAEHGWRVQRGEWKSPNPGRQWALETTDCDWIWHVDADDVHREDYLAGALAFTSNAHVGIIQADRVSGTHVLRTPEKTDYWGLRLGNYVDTSSLWRVLSLREAGGWHATDRWDDWDCALRVTALGWQTARNPVPSLCTVHPDHGNRNSKVRDFPHKWNRSYAMVALLAGREDCWDDWSNMVRQAEYPARTHFYLADNSRRPEFAVGVKALCLDLSERGFQVTTITLPDTFREVDWTSRHQHVAHLYNRILPTVTEDLTLFWEDDVLPTAPTPVRALVDHWDCTSVGGICAAYESRGHQTLVCAATGMDYWHGMAPLSQVYGKVWPGYGFLPGGFALYQTALIRRALPFHVQNPGGKMQGWDGQLSRCVRENGWRLDLDGLIPCEHRWRTNA